MEKEKSLMKKKSVNLITAVGVLVVLSGAYVGVKTYVAKQDAEEAKPAPEPPEPPGAEAVTGWEGDPPYRFIDVSRDQGLIDWAQVAAAGYKGAMLKTVSTNRKLSKRADGLYIDPTFETNYRNARAAGLDVGVYYYTYATSEAMADAELALLRQAVRDRATEREA